MYSYDAQINACWLQYALQRPPLKTKKKKKTCPWFGTKFLRNPRKPLTSRVAMLVIPESNLQVVAGYCVDGRSGTAKTENWKRVRR